VVSSNGFQEYLFWMNQERRTEDRIVYLLARVRASRVISTSYAYLHPTNTSERMALE
jgi:hypothetical protein